VLQLSSALRLFAQEEQGGGATEEVSPLATLLQRKEAKTARDARERGWPAFSAAVISARASARDELRKFRMFVSQLIESEVRMQGLADFEPAPSPFPVCALRHKMMPC